MKILSRLVQRIGRSEHKLGGVAKGCIISNWIDDLLESIVLKEKALKGEFEKTRVHEMALDVLSHQLVGIVLNFRNVDLSECLACSPTNFKLAKMLNHEKYLIDKELES